MKIELNDNAVWVSLIAAIAFCIATIVCVTTWQVQESNREAYRQGLHQERQTLSTGTVWVK